MYTYFKKYNKSSNNIIANFILGIICFIQVMIAPLIYLLLDNQEYVKTYGIFKTTLECIKLLINDPMDFLRFYLMAALFFIFGFVFSCNQKWMRVLGEIFIKKQSGYYISRDKQFLSIYLNDYAVYDKFAEKIETYIDPNNCLIESKGKKIFAFYIPADIIEKSGIISNHLYKVSINDKIYYKLILGGQSKIRKYNYNCQLITNKDKQLEVIQIEAD